MLQMLSIFCFNLSFSLFFSTVLGTIYKDSFRANCGGELLNVMLVFNSMKFVCSSGEVVWWGLSA